MAFREFKNITDQMEEYLIAVKCVIGGDHRRAKSYDDINIAITGNSSDISEKNFEILFQSISLRCTPTAMTRPVYTNDLSLSNTGIKGDGFIWRFGTDVRDAFKDQDDDVGLLIKELNNVVLYDGNIINTIGRDRNLAVIKLG
jgi:hypothetical protein